jgi:hypothetical protein
VKISNFAAQHLFEASSDQVRQELSVGECKVRSASNGVEILLAFAGVEGGTDQFAVRQSNSVFGAVFLEAAHVVFANLLAQAPGTAMNLHWDIAGVNVQASGSELIIDFADFVHLYRVVSGAECAQLIAATFVGPRWATIRDD